MLVLGIILVLLAAGSLVTVLASGTDDTAVLFGGNVSLPTLVVFLAGAAALLLLVLGVELMRSGVRRANENRRTKQKLRKLERREQARREEQGTAGEDGTVGDAGTVGQRADRDAPPGGPGATQRDIQGDTLGETRGASGTGAHARTDTGAHARTDGPYEAPPPPSR